MQDVAINFIVDNINACDEVWVVSKGAGENLKSLGYKKDEIADPNDMLLYYSKEQVEKIIQTIPTIDVIHCDSKNLENEYKKLMQTGEHKDIIIKNLSGSINMLGIK